MDFDLGSPSKTQSIIFASIISILCISGIGFGIYTAVNGGLPDSGGGGWVELESSTPDDITSISSYEDEWQSAVDSGAVPPMTYEEFISLYYPQGSSAAYGSNGHQADYSSGATADTPPTSNNSQLNAESAIDWCAGNMASLYSKYKSLISAAYNKSMTSCNSTCSQSSMSGSSFGGNTSCSSCRSQAQAEYGITKSSLANEYVIEAQSHGCDPYAAPYAYSDF